MRTIHQITTALDAVLREEDRALTFGDEECEAAHNYLRPAGYRRRAIVDLARELIEAARHADLAAREVATRQG